MKIKKWQYITIIVLALGFGGVKVFKRYNFNNSYTVGQPVDSLNGVLVYFNGGVDNVSGRNLSADGYNLGLKYQCVEFVKRYYYEYLQHKMPDSYGHARDFYDKSIADGEINPLRDLLQYSNPSISRPQPNDLLVFSGSIGNPYGHVAIISQVGEDEIEIIQQNPGPYGSSRERIKLNESQGIWNIGNDRVLGWLRKINQE